MHVRLQVFADILVSRREQKTRARTVGQAADVEGNHSGQRAIQRRRELVGDKPLRTL